MTMTLDEKIDPEKLTPEQDILYSRECIAHSEIEQGFIDYLRARLGCNENSLRIYNTVIEYHRDKGQ